MRLSNEATSEGADGLRSIRRRYGATGEVAADRAGGKVGAPDWQIRRSPHRNAAPTAHLQPKQAAQQAKIRGAILMMPPRWQRPD